MCGDDRTETRWNGTRLEAFHTQQVQSNRRTHDIDDRVHRADLVKVNLADVDPVDARLGLPEPLEDPLGQLVLPRGQRALVDHLFNVVQVAMRVFAGGLNDGMRGTEATSAHGLERQFARQTQARNRGLDGPGIHPGIDESPSVMSPEIPLKQSK